VQHDAYAEEQRGLDESVAATYSALPAKPRGVSSPNPARNIPAWLIVENASSPDLEPGGGLVAGDLRGQRGEGGGARTRQQLVGLQRVVDRLPLAVGGKRFA